MAGYFSFQKLITPRFVKFIYVVGLMAVTAGGIGLAIGAGLGLRSATLPTRMGVYYIAIGAGVVIVGNLVWRVFCEIWIVAFNIHNLLGSLESETRRVLLQRELPSEEHQVELVPDVIERERESRVIGHPASVLGLT
ncbi:MAG TPA: DUF4282 domain-containing protein [Pyrinomonadaceae bacterium]|jgi:hypothetical protein|nr:DUF4282 domain-containing protein [Pyrinomonadaceae bacterium]